MTYRLAFLDREVALHAGENLIGRVDDGVAWIESPTVSRRHARILVEAGQAILEDLGSKNGIFAARRRISNPTLLADGDVIQVGRISIPLHAVRPDQTTLSGAD